VEKKGLSGKKIWWMSFLADVILVILKENEKDIWIWKTN